MDKGFSSSRKWMGKFFNLIPWAMWDETGREREKKILLPNSVETRVGQENSEKNSKKLKKLKNSFRHYF